MAFCIPQLSRGGWGRQRDAMPLRWSLADPVASLAINMALQKELFAASQLPRRRVKDAYKEHRGATNPNPRNESGSPSWAARNCDL